MKKWVIHKSGRLSSIRVDVVPEHLAEGADVIEVPDREGWDDLEGTYKIEGGKLVKLSKAELEAKRKAKTKETFLDEMRQAQADLDAYKAVEDDGVNTTVQQQVATNRYLIAKAKLAALEG